LSGHIEVRIFRYNPETDREPRLENYRVPLIRNMAVLDVVMHVQNYLDGTLSFRCSCRIGMCGSCAMYVNGRPRLACRTQVSSLGTSVLELRPLPNLPVIKDLVVDMEPFFAKYREIKPYFEAREDLRDFVRISPGSRERGLIDLMLECITCGACYGACTMVATDPQYLGPAALNRAYCLVADGRDARGKERLSAVDGTHGVWRCHSQFNCAEVCPKKIVPTWSIQQLKKMCLFRRLGLYK